MPWEPTACTISPSRRSPAASKNTAITSARRASTVAIPRRPGGGSTRSPSKMPKGATCRAAAHTNPRPLLCGRKMSSEHEIEIRVRYSETDAMGFLHHGNYFALFEMGRTELLRSRGGNYRRMEEEGLYMVVVSVECKYRKPARYDDLLILKTRVSRITPAKIEHEYRLSRDGELLTEARSVLACVDRAGIVQRIPEIFNALV